MKKLGYLFLLVIFMIPTFVYAEETCDNKGVSVKMIKLKKTTGLTEELSDVEFEDNKINLDVKMYEVGDSVEYTLIIKNDSREDYVVNDKSSNEDNTIEYRLEAKDESNKIKKGTEEEFVLKATYKTEVEQEEFRSGKFDASATVLLKVEEAKLIPIDINPKTGNIFYLLISLMLGVSIIFLFKIKNKKVQTLMLSVFMLLPVSVLAECDYNIKLNSNIIIGYVKPNPCTYDGELVQGAEYTNGQYTYRYMQEYGYNNSTRLYEWQNIDNDGWGVTLTNKNSTDSVTTTLCTSINNEPIVSMKNMFSNSNTTNIDTSSFDTSNVTNMNSMFLDCNSLADIDVNNFDTSNVTDISYMFYNCNNLTELDLSSFDTSNVTNMTSVVGECLNLETLNLSNFDFRLYNDQNGALMLELGAGHYEKLKTLILSNSIFPSFLRGGLGYLSTVEEIILDGVDTSLVTNMDSLFNNDKNLTKIDLSDFNTSNVTSMINMFYECSSLKELDLSSFDTSKVSSFNGLVGKCNNLEDLNLSNFDFSNYNINSMFMNITSSGISKLKVLNMSNTKMPSNLNYAFGGLTSLEEIILDNIDTSNVTDMSGLFQRDKLLSHIDIHDFDTSNVTTMANMFLDCEGLTDFSYQGIDTSNVTNLSAMFMDCSSLTELDLSSFNTSSVTNMGNMFYGCNHLEKLNLSNWDFSKVSYGSMVSLLGNGDYLKELNVSKAILPSSVYTFGGLTSLETINLDYVKTSHITSFEAMFKDDSNLKVLDFSAIDTRKVTNFKNMFENCNSLTELYLDEWDFSSLTDLANLNYMFSNTNSLKKISMRNWIIPEKFESAIGCRYSNLCTTSLETVDVSLWDLSSTKNISGLFGNLYTKEIKGLNTWDTSNVINYSNMFGNCTALETLDISNFDFTNTTSFCNNIGSMFSSTTSLKKLIARSWKLPDDMSNAIFRCGGMNSSPIEEIDVSLWDLSNTTNTFGLLGSYGSNGLGGTGLKRIIGLNTWNTTHITNMGNMFGGLSSLTSIDLSKFDMSNVTNTDDMFAGCISINAAYGRTNSDITKLNSSRNKPTNITFVLKN